MTLGQRISYRRQELGLTQEELAKKMGYKTRNAIYQYEQVDNMKLSLVEKFAKALDCSPSYILGWDDEEPIKRELSEETATEDFEILTMYAQLSEPDKEIIKNMMKSLLSKQGANV